MYSQVLKYELNGISFYRSYACLINIFNSFLKRGLFLRVFMFIQHFLHILFELKTKGSITIALNYNKYITQIEDMLSDGSTYEVVKYDPLKKIINLHLSSQGGNKRNILIFTLTKESIVVMVIYLERTVYPKSISRIVH